MEDDLYLRVMNFYIEKRIELFGELEVARELYNEGFTIEELEDIGFYNLDEYDLRGE